MGDIMQRVKRIILSTISLGLIKYENPAVIGPYVVENMKKKLADLKASAVPVIANQYRIERMLSTEQAKLTQLDADARQAVLQNDDDLASSLLLQRESSQSRADDLKTQLEAAKQHGIEAKQQIELFQDELKEAADRARNAQMRFQLATMRQQVQKFAMAPSLDEDMKTLERMEERADQAYAESEALSDIAAIGDEMKVRQVRQAARKQRAESALTELKAEMGMTDTEKRFKKVSVEIGEGEQAESQSDDHQTDSAQQERLQQRVTESESNEPGSK